MTDQITPSENTPSRWGWLYKTTGAAALIAGILLMIGLLSLIITYLQAGTGQGPFSPLGNNWLILIFKLHAEFSGVQAESLHGLSLLDMVFLIIVGLISLSLSTVSRKARKVWLLIAGALSVVGGILFFATQMAGRSSVMLVVVIISLVMLGNRNFGKTIALSGILAGILLLAGDLTVGVRSNVITILFSIGYALLILWFFLMANIFFHLDRKVASIQFASKT